MSTRVGRSRLFLAAEVALYVAVALAAVSAALPSPDAVVGSSVDLHGTLWFYWWIHESARTLSDPSTTPLFFHPYGKDIFAHTGNHFLDALVAVPLHALLGPVAFHKWWVAVVLVGNALALRPLVRAAVDDRWAVVVAVVLYQVNPYFMFEVASGRVTQAFAWTLPLALLGLLRLERSWAWAVATGALVALTGYGYWFYAYFFCFAATWLVGLRLWEVRGDPGAARALVLRLALAAGVALALVAPAVLAMVGSDGPGTELLAPARGPEAIMGYLPLGGGGPRMLERAAWVAGIAAWVTVGRGRRRWLGVALVGLALATGPSRVLGALEVPMPHYRALVAAVPFLHRLLFPLRALVLVFIAASVGVATVVARTRVGASPTPARRALRVAAVAVLPALALADLAPFFPLPTLEVPRSTLHAWMGLQGGAVIHLPMVEEQVGFVNQIHTPLPVFSGMGEAASTLWPEAHTARLDWPCVRALRAASSPGEPLPATPAECTDLADQGFRWVVLHRDLVRLARPDGRGQILRQRRQAHAHATRALTTLLGEPVAVEGALVAWRLAGDEVLEVREVPPAMVPTRGALERRSW